MSDITVVNCETGDVEIRKMSAEEVAQRKQDEADAAAAAQASADALAAQAAATADAIAHAKSLGFTDAMIAVMYPNLVVP